VCVCEREIIFWEYYFKLNIFSFCQQNSLKGHTRKSDLPWIAQLCSRWSRL